MNFIFNKRIKRFFACMRSFIIPKESGTRILLYHSIGGTPNDHSLGVRVPASSMEAQIEELIRLGYTSATITEIINGSSSVNEDKLLAITFDDGYKDNIVFAVRILQKFNFKATFFVTISYIEQDIKKKWRNGQPREYMDWNDILCLNDMGFEIGSHMVNHHDLTALDDKALQYEFHASKEMLSEKLGKPIAIFSYPYGKVNEKAINAARDSGYIGGCSSFSGSNYKHTNRYILKRTEIDGYDTLRDFRYKLFGWYD